MENSEYSILKVYASTTDRIGTKLLYEYIVELARDKGISGVTEDEADSGKTMAC